jgi:PRC-barrel domain
VDDDGYAISYKALERGVPVVTSDGEQLGTVARVLDNAREHIFDGLVVRTSRGQLFVDAPEVVRIAERRVTLSIDAAEAQQLPHYERGGLVGRLFGKKR